MMKIYIVYLYGHLLVIAAAVDIPAPAIIKLFYIFSSLFGVAIEISILTGIVIAHAVLISIY